MEPRVNGAQAADVTLETRQERRTLPPDGGKVYVDFSVRAAAPPSDAQRSPLSLALVLDRSGSMADGKLDTAKRAALAVVDRLDERDSLAVVVFDDRVDVIQPARRVDEALKHAVRAGLAPIEPRGSTALHEGWLSGCHAIAPREPAAGVARCFLLTDGQANVGIVDTETIAAQAADVLEQARVGTTTFGVGLGYNEELLDAMASAGGGQFHHLPDAAQVATTFLGELGEMLGVAAQGVKLQFEADEGITADVVSLYRVAPDAARAEWMVTLGDLVGGEERHVVVR